MTRTSLFLLIILALGLAVLACASATPPPNLPGLLPYGDRVLEDRFVNNELGWDVYEGQEGVTGLENEAYKIQVKSQFTEILAYPKSDMIIPADVIVEVQALNAGSQDNYYGLICRYTNQENFYFLVISSDGYYGIGKVKDGLHSLVNRTEMPPTEVYDGGAINNLRAECTGSRLALYVNGSLLDVQNDTDLPQGSVGLIAGSFEQEVSIFFDDFRVYQPRK
jgi:hypothetical protein